MSTAPILIAFPRRPLGLVREKGRYAKRAFGLAAALLLFLPWLWWVGKIGGDFLLRRDLRERGVAAEVLRSDGPCYIHTTRFLSRKPKGCALDIVYRLRPEEGGGTRSAKVWLWGRRPISMPAAYYDPAAPGRVLLKPEIARGTTMDDFIPMFLLLLMPAGALSIWLFSSRKALAAAARRPRPVIVEIDRIASGPRSNRLEVRFRRSDDGREAVATFRTGGPLLISPPPGAPPGRQWGLALLGPKDVPLLLDSELSLIDLTPDARAGILRAAGTSPRQSSA
ncbi:MAG: hypothetical protein JWO81_3217 [Alphaproteobacteria bacterium]|nr:hypothetical protein [Alphaproteobacteria bacterium]